MILLYINILIFGFKIINMFIIYQFYFSKYLANYFGYSAFNEKFG
jgi:hypothetical protein